MKITRKTYITNAASKNAVMRSFCTENYSVGVEFVSLNVFLSNLINEKVDSNKEFCQIFNTLPQHISKDNLYYSMLRFPSFVQPFYQLCVDLIKAEIPLASLSEESKELVDRKEIITHIYQQDLQIKNIMSNLLNYNYQDTYIVDCYQPDWLNNKIIESMLTHGAKPYEFPACPAIHKQWYKAANAFDEVTALAQYIVQNKENLSLSSTAIMLADYQTYLPIITHIFSNYDIPLNIKKTIRCKLYTKFVNYLDYLTKNDMISFMLAYQNECFGPYNQDFFNYLDLFKINYQQLYQPFTIVSKWQIDENYSTRNYNELLRMESEAEKVREAITALPFPFNENLKQKTTFIYQQITTSIDVEDNIAYKQASELLATCQKIVPVCQNNPHLLTYFLKDKTMSIDINYDSAIDVININELALNKTHLFVLGCVNEGFPTAVSKTGFFNEEYLATIKNYPTLVERNRLAQQQFNKLFVNCENVIFSYPTNDLQGNNFTFSSYLNVKEEDWQNWSINKNDYLFFNNATLEPQIARQLYLKSNKLKASATSFESYVACHFSYFVKRGLFVREPADFFLNKALLGTICHNALQDLFKNNLTSIEPYLRKTFDNYLQLFVNQRELIELIYQLLLSFIKPKIETLLKARESSPLKPVDYEASINNIISMDDFDVVLSGKIDRVDSDSNDFMVIDYKSSTHDISLKNVEEGSRLQLLTYLYSYSKMSKQNCAAMAYYSLGSNAYNSMDDYEKNNKFTTYIIGNYNNLDDAYYKKGRKALFDSTENAANITEELYKIIANDIVSGNIAHHPTAGACSYCQFKHLCHEYQEYTAEKLINLSKDEGEEDARAE